MSKYEGTGTIMIVGEITGGKWHQHTTNAGRYYTCYCWGIKVSGIGKVANYLYNNTDRQVIITGEVKKDKSGIICFASRVQPITDYLKSKKINMQAM